jgi:hypothetical protein
MKKTLVISTLLLVFITLDLYSVTEYGWGYGNGSLGASNVCVSYNSCNFTIPEVKGDFANLNLLEIELDLFGKLSLKKDIVAYRTFTSSLKIDFWTKSKFNIDSNVNDYNSSYPDFLNIDNFFYSPSIGYKYYLGYQINKDFSILPGHSISLGYSHFASKDLQDINLDEYFGFSLIRNSTASLSFKYKQFAIFTGLENTVYMPLERLKIPQYVLCQIYDLAGVTAIDLLTEYVLIDMNKDIAPIAYFILSNGFSMLNYSMSKSDKNSLWPFDGNLPMTSLGYRIGLNYYFK